ncbi:MULTISPECIES: phosphoglycerol transferase [Rothia]|uniref:phosphoglycerol transferase n=1 Tax=Rothia TaxID=32207 RepID=UPI0008A991F6|nr:MULTISPECIES: phosphoglycerol transferase [Rothia]OHQ17601.1 phosphoglycerol transferase [Rothia sp. HMSC065C03]
MSFHHTQADPAGWGRRTMRATGCAAALLLALTGCFGGSQSENSSSTPSPSSTANHSQYPLPSSTASPSPTKKTEPTVTETQAPAPAESAEAKASESSAPAEAKETSTAAETPTGDTPRAPEKVEAERASAGERCGHIGRKGYLKTGAEIMVLRGTVDCAHALDVLTEYVTTPRADDNLTEHQVAKVQDATCYWNPQYEMAENRREDRGAPECTIGEDVAFVARLQNPDAPEIPFLMEPSYYDSGAGYYRFKSDDERTLCELNPADGTLVCERRTGEQTGDGNGAVGRTFAGPVEVTRMNFLTGASEVNTANGSSALHAETTTANTKMMHTWDVVTVPAADGNQLTCFGEIENSSISCHDGNGHTILVRGRHEG